MGRTVAIFKKGFNGAGWEYYVQGSEREARIVAAPLQSPGNNSNETPPVDPNDLNDPQVGVYAAYLEDVEIGKDQATFYVNDHLGNTRITFVPVAIYGTSTIVMNDDFNTNSVANWIGSGANAVVAGQKLSVTTNINTPIQMVSKNLPLGTFNIGETYVMILDADLGNTPNGVRGTAPGSVVAR